MAQRPGLAVNLTAWICMVGMCIVVIMKLGGKYVRVHRFQIDDYVVAAAMLLGVAQTVTASVAVTSGLGQDFLELTAGHQRALGKSNLASQLLYIVVNCLAEAAYVMFLKGLSMKKLHIRCGIAILGFIAARGIATLLAAAFQCPAPNTWSLSAQGCIDRTAFWGAFAALDVVTIVLIVSLSTYIVYGLQMPAAARSIVAAALAVKILVLPTIILRALWLGNSTRGRDMVEAAIATQVDLNLNIVTTCVPFLRVIMDRMESDFFASDLRLPTTDGSRDGTGGHAREIEMPHKTRTRVATRVGRGPRPTSDWRRRGAGIGLATHATAAGGPTSMSEGEARVNVRGGELAIHKTTNISTDQELATFA